MQNESNGNASDSPESKSLFDKVKEHKKEIIIVGVTVAAVVGVVLMTKNWDSIKRVVFSRDSRNTISKQKNNILMTTELINISITENVSIERAVDVSKHLRNLPVGWNASLSKIESAIEHGFILEEHQTWVENYTKICA